MKKNKPKFRLYLFLGGFVLLIFALLKYTNDRVMPSVIKTMEMHAANKSVRAIDGAVKRVISQSGVSAQDLYVKSTAENGRLTSLSANTVLINTICTEIADEILSSLETLSGETVYLPLGIITGMDFLAEKGPQAFKISVRPRGNCLVDYKTSFKSEGINQVNYQIWFEIKVAVAAVNPVLSRDFVVEKRLPVVNVYIGGEVPESMMYPFKLE